MTLFPEGTRSHDGKLGPLKPGIAVLVQRVGVPVIPAGLGGHVRDLAEVATASGAATHSNSLRPADLSCGARGP